MNRPVIAIIGGARPNFVKIAPLVTAFKQCAFDFFVVNTGQHFDKEMSTVFFDQFGLTADVTLTPSIASPDAQNTDIMRGLQEIFQTRKPNLVVVVGDVNSTLAAALVADKLGIPVAHVEAGLRSFNNAMPEESNRIRTDRISTLLFATEQRAVDQLRTEGITNHVYLVGNVMADTLFAFEPRIPASSESYYFCTLHRAENVDTEKVFTGILDALETMAKDDKIYLPLHPRTKKMAEAFGLLSRLETIFTLLPPLGYVESLTYQKNAKLILTDSGGIQEEASILGIPCLTLRSETERPITVEQGTNTIAGVTKDSILAAYRNKDLTKRTIQIPLWDGKASERIALSIVEFLK